MGIFDRIKGKKLPESKKAKPTAQPAPPSRDMPDEGSAVLEDGIPFGWISHHWDFHEQCMQIDIELRRKASEAHNDAATAAALREALPKCEAYEREFLKRGVYFQRYFHQLITKGIQESIEKAEKYQAIHESYEAQHREIKIAIMQTLKKQDSVLQSDLVKQFPEQFAPEIRAYIAELVSKGTVVKEKEGRTFRLRMKK